MEVQNQGPSAAEEAASDLSTRRALHASRREPYMLGNPPRATTLPPIHTDDIPEELFPLFTRSKLLREMYHFAMESNKTNAHEWVRIADCGIESRYRAKLLDTLNHYELIEVSLNRRWLRATRLARTRWRETRDRLRARRVDNGVHRSKLSPLPLYRPMILPAPQDRVPSILWAIVAYLWTCAERAAVNVTMIQSELGLERADIDAAVELGKRQGVIDAKKYTYRGVGMYRLFLREGARQKRLGLQVAIQRAKAIVTELEKLDPGAQK